jgi:hypothetical protein
VFVNSPLVIAFLASTYQASGKIPENRARLFSMIADWLFESRSALRSREDVDLGTAKRVLEAVAFSYVDGLVARGAVTEEVIASAANLTGLEKSSIEKVVKIETVGANCLVEADGRLTFWHESLCDYFAARWLIYLFRRGQRRIPEKMDAVMRSVELRDVGDMLIALLSMESVGDIEVLLDKTAPVGNPSVANIRAAALQSRILEIATSHGFKCRSDKRKAIVEGASEYLRVSEDRMRGMSEADRIQAFCALGRLRKDSRLYGSPVRRSLPVGADEGKRIGKFPITVQEYARF